jgi:hypothetical protein
MLRKYLNTVNDLKDCTSLDLTFFDYSEIPRFAMAWATKRQKARNRWFWAISKTKNIIKKSMVSVFELSAAEVKATDMRASDVSKVIGANQTDSNIMLERSAFDVSRIEDRLDEYYGRESASSRSSSRGREAPDASRVVVFLGVNVCVGCRWKLVLLFRSWWWQTGFVFGVRGPKSVAVLKCAVEVVDMCIMERFCGIFCLSDD